MEILTLSQFYYGLLFATSLVFIMSGFFYLVLQFVAFRFLKKEPLRWPYSRFQNKNLTIIISAYNEEKSILNSVRSCLNQTYPNIEIIVVNDGSKDRTLKVLIEEFNLKEMVLPEGMPLSKTEISSIFSSDDDKIIVVNKKNTGKADSLNVGVSLSKNEYIATIDADSVLDPVAIDRVMQEFFINKKAIAVGASVLVGNGSVITNGKIKKLKISVYIQLIDTILIKIEAF